MRRSYVPATGLAAALLAVACAACGSAAAPAQPAASSASSGGAAPAASGTMACAAGALRVTGLRTQAGTMPGTVTSVEFRNTGTGACTLDGWPAVAIASPGPVRAGAKIRRQGDTAAFTIARTRVRLAPGASATASLLIATPQSAASCAAPAWRVTPPPGRGPATVLRPAAGPRVCAGSTVVVSPVYPGARLRAHFFGPSPGHSPT